MNHASPELALRFQRSQINQPDLTFPQSPGIILKRTTLLLPAVARFVLSMNWKHHIMVPVFAYVLICTTYPPKTHCEQRVNNSNPPLKSRLPTILAIELFTAKRQRKIGGEQVGAGIFWEKIDFAQSRRLGPDVLRDRKSPCLLINPDIINIHVGQAVIPRQINMPTAASG